MDNEDRICPINPHGNGYCKGERCALWNKYTTSYGGKIAEDETFEDCAVNIIAFNLFLLGKDK